MDSYASLGILFFETGWYLLLSYKIHMWNDDLKITQNEFIIKLFLLQELFTEKLGHSDNAMLVFDTILRWTSMKWPVTSKLNPKS